MVINAIKQNPSELEVHQQGLALIITILAPDKNTKMNQGVARQSVLASGIFDILQASKNTFADQKDLHAYIKQIMDILIADWS